MPSELRTAGNTLIPCPSCGREIAASANSCPGCGAVNSYVHPEIKRFIEFAGTELPIRFHYWHLRTKVWAEGDGFFGPNGKTFQADFSSGSLQWTSTDETYWAPVRQFFHAPVSESPQVPGAPATASGGPFAEPEATRPASSVHAMSEAESNVGLQKYGLLRNFRLQGPVAWLSFGCALLVILVGQSRLAGNSEGDSDTPAQFASTDRVSDDVTADGASARSVASSTDREEAALCEIFLNLKEWAADNGYGWNVGCDGIEGVPLGQDIYIREKDSHYLSATALISFDPFSVQYDRNGPLLCLKKVNGEIVNVGKSCR
jgi:hypothetical protein